MACGLVHNFTQPPFRSDCATRVQVLDDLQVAMEGRVHDHTLVKADRLRLVQEAHEREVTASLSGPHLVRITGVLTRGMDVLNGIQVATLTMNFHCVVDVFRLRGRHEPAMRGEPREQLYAITAFERHTVALGLPDPSWVLYWEHSHEPLRYLEPPEERCAAHHVHEAHACVVELLFTHLE